MSEAAAGAPARAGCLAVTGAPGCAVDAAGVDVAAGALLLPAALAFALAPLAGFAAVEAGVSMLTPFDAAFAPAGTGTDADADVLAAAAGSAVA